MSYKNYDTYDNRKNATEEVVEDSSYKSPMESKTKYGIVRVSNTHHVKLRERPSNKAAVLKILNSGDKVEILGEEKGYYKIDKRGSIGYIFSKFIEEI